MLIHLKKNGLKCPESNAKAVHVLVVHGMFCLSQIGTLTRMAQAPPPPPQDQQKLVIYFQGG